MKTRSMLVSMASLLLLLLAVARFAFWYAARTRDEQKHYERQETHVQVSAPRGAALRLFRAGGSLSSSLKSRPQFQASPGCRAEITCCERVWAE